MNVLEKRYGQLRTALSLPNYTAAGSYCFFSECIFLNALEEKDYLAISDKTKDTDSQYKELERFMPLLNHEVKHWYDAHSTLWGLKLINDIYERRDEYYAVQNGGIEAAVDHFDKQVNLKDSIEYIRFPKYYSTNSAIVSADRPWKYNYSVGRIFSKYGALTERPVFFTRFNNLKNESIARVPFSLCALLESSAVSQELNTKVGLVAALTDPINRKLEQDKLAKKTISDLYDKDIVEYSVVAHKVANTFELKNAIEAYSISAAVTRLILNITDDVIDLLDPENLLSEQFSLFFPSYCSAIRYHDRGAIFSLLIDALYSQYHSKGKVVDRSNVEQYLEEIFLSATKHNFEQITEKSVSAIERLCSEISITLDRDHLQGTLTLGADLHRTLGLIGPAYIDFSNVFVPDIILGDNTFFSQQGSRLESFEKRYFELTEYQKLLNELSSACIA